MKTSVSDKLTNDLYNQKIFDVFRNVYLVGGCIRDALLKRPCMDRDYAVDEDPLKIARKIQLIFPGKIIQFRDNLTVRIALVSGGNLDFTRLSCDIERDLSERDFTMNSIAFSAREGLIDPFGGGKDIKGRLIRATHYENLTRDPIRLLRAFRFMSELNWDIEEGTRKAIRDNRMKISHTASERITFELIHLMNGRAFIRALQESKKLGILKTIICLNNNRLNINIKNIIEINEFIKTLPYRRKRHLSEPVTQGLSKRSMIFFSALIRNNNISCNLLTISSKLFAFNKYISNYHQITHRNAYSILAILRLFRSMKDFHIELGIYAKDPNLIKQAEKYLEIKRVPLLNGHEIKNVCGISGPAIGNVLKQLETGQFLGKLTKKGEAEEYLKNYVIKQSPI